MFKICNPRCLMLSHLLINLFVFLSWYMLQQTMLTASSYRLFSIAVGSFRKNNIGVFYSTVFS